MDTPVFTGDMLKAFSGQLARAALAMGLEPLAMAIAHSGLSHLAAEKRDRLQRRKTELETQLPRRQMEAAAADLTLRSKKKEIDHIRAGREALLKRLARQEAEAAASAKPETQEDALEATRSQIIAKSGAMADLLAEDVLHGQSR
jgi:hypothetical protein